MALVTALRSRSFNFVHRNHLIYNTCWEDPRVDHAALNLTDRDTVLMITSAGCNALDYALAGPKHVYAVDMNPRQNALLELKIAAIKRLTYEDFFSLFGQGKLDGYESIYQSTLRPMLSDRAKAFWDENADCFDGLGRRPSFYFRGTSGWFAWMINQYINRVARIRDAIDAALDAPSVEAQQKIYQTQLQQAFWRPQLRWFLRRDCTMSLLGVPRPQRDQIDRDYHGGVAQFAEDCVAAVFGKLPLKDNYFWRVYLTGRYTPECCPAYLKPENFERLRNGLVDRISVHTSSIATFLRRHEVKISRYILLDHMDWLSAADHPALRQEWQQIVRRSAPKTRLLWRSAGLKSDFVDRVPVQYGGRKVEVGSLLSYQRGLAEELHQVDRVHTYGSFHIADFAAA